MNAVQPALQEETVPLRSRVWVAAADASCALLNNFATGGALTYYFIRWRGMDPNLSGLVWLLFAIWNAINDPLFGYISDRTKSNLGRRIPYIRYGVPIYVLAFILFWVVLPGSAGNQTAMFIQLLLALFIFDALYTAIATSLYVMPYEMAISNKARSSIYVWKILFAIFPLAIPLVLIPMIQPGPGESAGVYQWVMVAFAVGVAAIIFFSTFFYQEKHFTQAEEQPPFLKSIKECLSNRSFLIFEVISFTVIYVQAGLMQGIYYYFDEIDVPAAPLYAALAIGIVASVIVFVRKRDAWGIKKSTRLMSLVFSIGGFLILFFGHSLVPTAIGMFCFGVGFGGGMYLIPLMNGDVVDADENKTGLRREGMYAGVNSFITKPAISLANAIIPWILGMYGYNPSLAKGTQSASAETGILVAWALIPAILLLICFIALNWYPLDGSPWLEIKHRLSARNAEKERKYLESLGYRVAASDQPAAQTNGD